jgi:hypothetical protein
LASPFAHLAQPNVKWTWASTTYSAGISKNSQLDEQNSHRKSGLLHSIPCSKSDRSFLGRIHLAKSNLSVGAAILLQYASTIISMSNIKLSGIGFEHILTAVQPLRCSQGKKTKRIEWVEKQERDNLP